MHYIFLLIAIVSEVVATTSLKATNGFTNFWPSCITIFGYAAAFYFLALTLKYIPIGVAYAIWSGIGIILITIIGYFLYNQKLNLAEYLGIILILIGVIIINLFTEPIQD